MGFHFIEGKPDEKVSLKKLEEVLDKRDESNKGFYSKVCDLFGIYDFVSLVYTTVHIMVALAAARFLGVI